MERTDPTTRENFSDSQQQKEKGLEKEAMNYYLKYFENSYTPFSINSNLTWEEFSREWGTFGPTKALLEFRKNWVAVRSYGEEFQKLIEGKIALDLSEKKSVFHLVGNYIQLGYDTAPSFLAWTLEHPAIWTDYDSSTASEITKALGKSPDIETGPAIVKYIENILSPRYQRNNHVDYDIAHAVDVLRKIKTDDEVVEILSKLTENSDSFASWFSLNKAVLEMPEWLKFDGPHRGPILPGLFDLEREQARLAILEMEYSQARESKKETKNSPTIDSWGEDEYYFENYMPENIGDDITEEGVNYEKPRAKFNRFIYSSKGAFNPDIYSSSDEALDPQITEFRSLNSFDREAMAWEQNKSINFYNRFKPDTKSKSMISENSLGHVFSMSLAPENQGLDSYVDFLNGYTNKQKVQVETGGTQLFSLESAYRATSLTYVHALCLALFDQQTDKAISEIRNLQSFLDLVGTVRSTDNEKKFLDSLAHYLDEMAYYIRTNSERFASLNFPESSKAFLIYNEANKKVREIVDFRTLLTEKIRYWLAADLWNNINDIRIPGGSPTPDSGPSFPRITQIINSFVKAVELYNDVEKEEIPLYWESKGILEEFNADKNVIFGRDGRYFFTALKAADFGEDKKDLKYVIVSRPMSTQQSNKRLAEERVANYLQQNGVTLDFVFIDTGYQGSVPEFAINSLATAGGISFLESEIDEKILLMKSDHSQRESLAKNKSARSESSVVGTIEHRPKSIQRPNEFTMQEGGKLVPKTLPSSIMSQVFAWTVEHAVMRNFAPRFNPEKRARYFQAQQKDLEGYRFLSEFYGSHIGTHPMELWENSAHKKILLKGGPQHTLRADLAGQRFLKAFGLNAPEASLIETEQGLKLKIEFMEGWEAGGIELPTAFENNEYIQEALLIDALLMQYDRTPWNLLFKGGDVCFIDNGTGLTSRARGGFKGFSNRFDIGQLKELLENPQFPGKPVNKAYHSLIEVVDDRVIVKDKFRFASILDKFKMHVSVYYIHQIVNEAGFEDGRISIKHIKEDILPRLEKEVETSQSDSKDRKKLLDAIETYHEMIIAGGEASYLKSALVQRRDDILNLLLPLTFE